MNDHFQAVSREPNTLRRGLTALCLASCAALLFWQLGGQQARTWSEQELYDVQLSDERYRLDRRQMDWLESLSSQHFDGTQEQALQIARRQISAQLDASFRAVEQRIPLFADWYYSLNGEYSRLSMSVLARLDLAEGDYLSRRASEILFPEAVWEATLAQLDTNTVARLDEQWRQSTDNWLSRMQGQLALMRVPPPLSESVAQSRASLITLNALAAQIDTLVLPQAMSVRLAASSVGTMGLAGPALWRAVVARNSVNTARLASAEVAALGASRGGSAVAGAAICLPGGPIAIACAAVAGAATWIATDWLLLQVDEAMNREALVMSLEEGLASLRTGLEQELIEAYDQGIEQWRANTQSVIENTFSLVEANAKPLGAASEIQ
jgi:hypothetical protein